MNDALLAKKLIKALRRADRITRENVIEYILLYCDNDMLLSVDNYLKHIVSDRKEKE